MSGDVREWLGRPEDLMPVAIESCSRTPERMRTTGGRRRWPVPCGPELDGHRSRPERLRLPHPARQGVPTRAGGAACCGALHLKGGFRPCLLYTSMLRLKAEAYEIVIEIAEEQFNIPIQKKPGAKQLRG